MASANALGYILPISVGSVAVAGGMSLAHVDMKKVILNFATGPGRTSRILLAIFVVTNWKNMPFIWTVSILHSTSYLSHHPVAIVASLC